MITHERIMIACGLATASKITSEDIIYTTLPLYHSAALLLGLHGCIMQGRMHLTVSMSYCAHRMGEQKV